MDFAYYTFCHVYKSLLVTPEMEAGIADTFGNCDVTWGVKKAKMFLQPFPFCDILSEAGSASCFLHVGTTVSPGVWHYFHVPLGNLIIP